MDSETRDAFRVIEEGVAFLIRQVERTNARLNLLGPIGPSPTVRCNVCGHVRISTLAKGAGCPKCMAVIGNARVALPDEVKEAVARALSWGPDRATSIKEGGGMDWVKPPRDEHKITEHFSWTEAVCRHCGLVPSHAAVINTAQWLEFVREMLGGAPIHVTSWCRCPEHNEAVGGAPESLHMLGWAVDITVRGMLPDEVQEKCARLQGIDGPSKVGGLGRYKTWTHIDRGKVRTWVGP